MKLSHIAQISLSPLKFTQIIVISFKFDKSSYSSPRHF